MNKEPFISIAIASYNYANHLRNAIEMIKKSDFRDFEIVYCDDCSTDNSVEVIDSIIKENSDLNIRLIQNDTNQGILKTKTRLIYECKGKYIMICDADDYMAEHCLDRLTAVAKKTDADRIVSEVYDIETGESGEQKIIQKQDIPNNTSKWLWNLNHGCLYKRDILLKNNIELDFAPDDVCLTVYFSQFSRSVAWIRKPLYYWCVHDDSAGRKKDNNHTKKIIAEFKKAVEKIDLIYENECKRNAQLIELLIIKLYYLQLFHSLRNCSLRDKLSSYSHLNKIICESHRDYLNNELLKLPQNMPLRKYAKNIIIISTKLERIHLMKLGLIGYHFLSKIIYFDQ